MNESGRSAGEAMRFYKLGEKDVVVFHDELDLAPGKVRVKVGGGAAGHNGLKSLSAHLGNDYARVRIGIGHPGHRERVVGYVMNDFAKAESDWLDTVLAALAGAAPYLAEGANDKFQTQVAYASQGEEPDKQVPNKKEPAPAPKRTDDQEPAKEAPLSAKLRRWLGS